MLEKDELHWVKKGDFSKCLNSGGDLTNMVSYTAKKDAKFLTIELLSYSGTTLGIRISAPSNIIKPLINELINVDFPFGKVDTILKNTLQRVNKENINRLATYLTVVEQFLPIRSIKKDIFNTLGIKAIPNEAEFYAQLEQLILDDKIDQALSTIAAIDDEHVSWKLGNLLEEHGKFPEALDLYQAIPSDNSHYSEANQRCENLLLQSEMFSPDITAEEKNNNLESKIRFMLRADNAENQRLLDQRFSELSANPFFEPCVTNIKTNEDTLIALARHTASLQHEILALRATVAQLKSQASSSPDSFFYNKQIVSADDDNKSSYPLSQH